MARTAVPAPTQKQPRRRKTSVRGTPQHAHELDALIQKLKHLELLEEDGEPLESQWHVMQIHLLIELTRQHLGEPTHYFCGGNMFVYYSTDQAEAVKTSKTAYKGPDFFVVRGVDGTKLRRYWVAWEEGGRYPDLVVELVSPSTAKKDKEDNLRFYAEVLRVAEYFWYDPDLEELRGYGLRGSGYEAKEADERGWLWSEVLGAYIGLWEGWYEGRVGRWLRLYGSDGRLVPTVEEVALQERARAEQERARAEQEHARAGQERQRAEQERQRAEQERARAEQAEAELRRLRELLRERGIEEE